MDLRRGILETANALGMDPIDLATIISYETAGTFDPRKKGPTTQWGQHEGLIQWGDPQGEQYGVDLSSQEAALATQLGANGAIARYYVDRGWQPGMGMLDAYSIVNAGSPGRYNASDANNGGAPGSVRDKVETQMGAHREKAMALLGGMGGVGGGNALAANTQIGGFPMSGQGWPQQPANQLARPTMADFGVNFAPVEYTNRLRPLDRSALQPIMGATYGA